MCAFRFWFWFWFVLVLMGPVGLPGCSIDTRLADERRNDAGGSSVPPGPDTLAPVLGEVALSIAADCVRLRVSSDEPATVIATFRGREAAEERVLGTGATLFDLATRLDGLEPGETAAVTLVAEDAQGNRSQPTEPLAFPVPPRPSALVITELLINPVGPETTQEYVEIHNRGREPYSLHDVKLEDDAGSDLLPPMELPAGRLALVVGAAFDPLGPGDVPPAPDTLILRVGGRLGRDGLRQSGEAIQLRGPDGLVLSSYGGWVDASRPAWQGRSVHRVPDSTACDHPRSWSDSPQPSTPGW